MKKEKQYDEEGRVIRENRSQVKREREQVRIFAGELLKLPVRQYPLLPVNETLISALEEGKRLSGNALKRHLNYLTRLIDEQGFEQILHAHKHINHPYLQDRGKQQRIQREIERLLAGDKTIIAELLERYAQLDIQYLRQLVREAQKHLRENDRAADEENAPRQTPGKHQKQLQKYLQTLALNYRAEDTPEE